MTFNEPIYKIQSGAEKKRLKQAEQAVWDSKNGPVIVRKIVEAFENYESQV
jgi:hypothetical protein